MTDHQQTKAKKVKKNSHRIKKIAIGLLVSMILAGIFGMVLDGSRGFITGITSFYAFLMIATICTAGIGGIVIFTAFYGVGSIVLILYHTTRGDTHPGKDQLFVDNGSSIDVQAIVVYIHDAKTYGIDDNTIVSTLRSKGWTDDQIGQAKELAKNSS